MKRFYKTIFVLLVSIFLFNPISVFADPGIKNDSAATTGGKLSGNTTTVNDGWVRFKTASSNAGGIRITFIDVNGSPIYNESFDFVTSMGNLKGSSKIIYNTYNGAKGKVQLRDGKNFKKGEKKMEDIPSFLTLYKNYRDILQKDYPNDDAWKKDVNYYDKLKNNPGNLSAEFKYEEEWLKYLTSPDLDGKVVVKKMRAFIKALAKTVTSSKTKQTQIKDTLIEFLENKCENEMFMEFDAMIHAVNSKSTPSSYLLTLTEMGHVGANEGTQIFYAAPKAIMYDKTVGNFQGFSRVDKNNIPSYQKYTDFLNTTEIGLGCGLDWIKRDGKCTECNCQIKNGKLVCKEPNDKKKIVKTIYSDTDTKLTDKQLKMLSNKYSMNSWYESIDKYAVFAFADKSDGGMSCCDVFKEDYKNDKMPANYKKAYDYVCNNFTNVCDCEYKNEKLYCNIAGEGNVKITKNKIPNEFKPFLETKYLYLKTKPAIYAFASEEDKGLGCCNKFENYYNGNKFNSEWKKTYEEMCLEKNKPSECNCYLKTENNVSKMVCYETVNGIQNQEVVYEDTSTGSKLPNDPILNNTITLNKVLDKYAVYALSDKISGGRGCCDQFRPYYLSNSMSADWKKAFEKLCPRTCDPIDNDEPLSYDINNCCTDGTVSKVEEYNLKELFCEDTNLNLDYYVPKTNASEFYKDKDAALNEYCELYCTEKLEVEIPGAITAISGKYFTLSETSKKTTSPYMEGTRRCKMRIEYDKWEQDYQNLVDIQVSNFNTYQEKYAYYNMYNNAKKEEASDTAKITCVPSNTTDFKNKEDTCKVTYDKYTFTPQDYYGVKKVSDKVSINIASAGKLGTASSTYLASNFDKKACTEAATKKAEGLKSTYRDKDDETCKCKYNKDKKKIICTNDGKEKEYTTNTLNDDVKADIKNCCTTIGNSYGDMTEKWKAEFDNLCPEKTVTYTCTVGTIDAEDSSHSGNLDELKKKYMDEANVASASYKAAVDNAKLLEEKIDKCDKFFTDYEGKDGNKVYKLNPNPKFSYSQAYINDNGDTEIVDIDVPFKEQGCTITGPIFAPDNELDSDQYSPKYGTDSMHVTDFINNKDISFISGSDGWKNFVDNTYTASKKFSTDAKYNGVCKWEEEENTIYTLIPTGTATSNSTLIDKVYNYTMHNRVYNVFLSTLDGTYETHWKVSGLGNNGRFDKIFETAGKTCANKEPSTDGIFTCKLHVEHQLIKTGLCNPTGKSQVTSSPDDCDTVTEGHNLFTFRVVDQKDLFPTTQDLDKLNYAYNWLKTDNGKKVKDEIEAIGKSEKTFAPENLTYSFILNSNDMKHIKEYNRMNNQNGGYTDFELDCSECDVIPCVRCKSRLLTSLADKKITYNNVTYEMSGWSGIKSLKEVRESW